MEHPKYLWQQYNRVIGLSGGLMYQHQHLHLSYPTWTQYIP